MKQISESLKSFTDLKKNFTFPPPPQINRVETTLALNIRTWFNIIVVV